MDLDEKVNQTDFQKACGKRGKAAAFRLSAPLAAIACSSGDLLMTALSSP
jgi:hypothetical protein